jgi:hypothetical protein
MLLVLFNSNIAQQQKINNFYSPPLQLLFGKPKAVFVGKSKKTPEAAEVNALFLPVIFPISTSTYRNTEEATFQRFVDRKNKACVLLQRYIAYHITYVKQIIAPDNEMVAEAIIFLTETQASSPDHYVSKLIEMAMDIAASSKKQN